MQKKECVEFFKHILLNNGKNRLVSAVVFKRVHTLSPDFASSLLIFLLVQFKVKTKRRKLLLWAISLIDFDNDAIFSRLECFTNFEFFWAFLMIKRYIWNIESCERIDNMCLPPSISHSISHGKNYNFTPAATLIEVEINGFLSLLQ